MDRVLRSGRGLNQGRTKSVSRWSQLQIESMSAFAILIWSSLASSGVGWLSRSVAPFLILELICGHQDSRTG